MIAVLLIVAGCDHGPPYNGPREGDMVRVKIDNRVGMIVDHGYRYEVVYVKFPHEDDNDNYITLPFEQFEIELVGE